MGKQWDHPMDPGDATAPGSAPFSQQWDMGRLGAAHLERKLYGEMQSECRGRT